MNEIERKFLIEKIPENIDFRSSEVIEQYYISATPELTVRARKYGSKFFLTFKKGQSLVRLEKEIEISEEDFEDLKLFNPQNFISKERRICFDNEYKIELDIFRNTLSGLIVAEIEFKTEQDALLYVPPKWFGREVTEDFRYTNSNLSVTRKIPE